MLNDQQIRDLLDNRNGRLCEICGKELTGKQDRFCSRECQAKDSNVRNQNYEAQQTRGWERKKQLVRLLGDGCSICGYNKNVAALDFHHRDPSQKKFNLDIRNLSNRRIEKVVEEVQKCDVICANCHRELHCPQGEL